MDGPDFGFTFSFTIVDRNKFDLIGIGQHGQGYGGGKRKSIRQYVGEFIYNIFFHDPEA